MTPVALIRARRSQLQTDIMATVSPLLEAFAAETGMSIDAVDIEASYVTYEDGRQAIATLTCSLDHATI